MNPDGVLPPRSGAILELRGVTKWIDTGTHRVDILRGIDLSIERGEYVAVMGPSGSGKSTLLGLLAGLDAPSSGSIRIEGEEISGLGENRLAEIRGRKIGFVFQSYQLIPTLTAEENVLLPAELAGELGAEAYERAARLIDLVGLSERRDHYPVQLSGGEQQRVALARAFMRRPPLLLADEPTGNLDSKTGEQVLDLLLRLNRQEGATLVLVTHDSELARHASRILTMKDGLMISDQRSDHRSPQAVPFEGAQSVREPGA
jgi:putative ABC transport system ATP-binding protein